MHSAGCPGIMDQPLAKGDGYMAKRTKRVTTRGKQKRGKATKRTQSRTKKTKRIAAQKTPKRGVGKAKPKTAAKKAAARKPKPKPEQRAETVIVDVVEEPVPGVMVVSEFEATRVLDSEEE